MKLNEATNKDIHKFSGYGWLDPNGKLIDVKNSYLHFSWLEKNISWVKKELDHRERMEQDDAHAWVDDLGPDEHPAWHAYYSDNDEDIVKIEILNTLYSKGWLRIGTDVKDNMIGVEGLRKFYIRNKKLMDDLAHFLGKNGEKLETVFYDNKKHKPESYRLDPSRMKNMKSQKLHLRTVKRNAKKRRKLKAAEKKNAKAKR